MSIFLLSSHSCAWNSPPHTQEWEPAAWVGWAGPSSLALRGKLRCSRERCGHLGHARPPLHAAGVEYSVRRPRPTESGVEVHTRVRRQSFLIAFGRLEAERLPRVRAGERACPRAESRCESQCGRGVEWLRHMWTGRLIPPRGEAHRVSSHFRRRCSRLRLVTHLLEGGDALDLVIFLRSEALPRNSPPTRQIRDLTAPSCFTTHPLQSVHIKRADPMSPST